MTPEARVAGARRILWVATKSPRPPVDGGRLLMQVSVEALGARGIDVEVVAPERPGPASWPRALVRALRERLPVPVARHRSPELADRVRASIRDRWPVAVHVEQVHALPQAVAARELDVPVVLRAQNVESDLWRQAAESSMAAPIGRLLARRLAAWEGRAVAGADCTLALTESDRRALERLAGGRGRVLRPTVPFLPSLSPGDPLPGSPAVSLFVGRGWAPSRDGGAWFVREAWPEVLRRSPGARLHVFGDVAAGSLPSGVASHPPPEDSRTAFPEGGILVVPLWMASGIRMKVLESWSRGLPVVGTSRALQGLEGEDGREWLRADEPRTMAEAITALAEQADLRSRLIDGGRHRLQTSHAPDRFADDYLAVLSEL